jgi:hypothetical protein
MTTIIELLTGDLGKWLAAALIALFGALGIYAKGRTDANRKADNTRLKEKDATNDAITNAPKSDTPADARAWLDGHAERLRDGRKP